jgi:hypothetical protein
VIEEDPSPTSAIIACMVRSVSVRIPHQNRVHADLLYRIVVTRLSKPLLIPDFDEHDGYVPNAVYSCGSPIHAATVYIPYGIANQSICYCTVSELLTAIR